MIIKLSENSVKLCCNKNGCPIIELGADEKFTIKDDYNNVVILTKDEILNLSKAAESILNK